MFSRNGIADNRQAIYKCYQMSRVQDQSLVARGETQIFEIIIHIIIIFYK